MRFLDYSGLDKVLQFIESYFASKQELEDVNNSIDKTAIMIVDTESGFASIDETTDGNIDGVKLRGKSICLANLINYESFNQISTTDTLVVEDNVYKLTKNSVDEISYLVFGFQSEPNTKYKISYEVVKNTITTADKENFIFYPDGVFGDFVSMNNTFPMSTLGKHSFELTTKEDTVRNKFSLGFHKVNVGAELWIKDFKIQNIENGYFEGFKSVGQDTQLEIMSYGENICPINNASATVLPVIEGFNKLDTVICANIKINPTLRYVLQGDVKTNLLCLIGHNKKLTDSEIKSHTTVYESTVGKNNGTGVYKNQFISGYEYLTITTGSGFSSSLAQIGEVVDITNIMLSTSLVPYVPYIGENRIPLLKPVKQSDGTVIYNPIILRGVDDNVYDSISKVNDKYVLTQKCDERGYQVGDENNVDVITDMTTTIYKLDNPIITELPYDLNLKTYTGQTNFMVNGNIVQSKLLFEIKNRLVNVVKKIMDKVILLEENFMESQKKQDKVAIMTMKAQTDMYEMMTPARSVPNSIVDIYVQLIRLNEKTLDQVPLNIISQVGVLCVENGYMTVEEMNSIIKSMGQ